LELDILSSSTRPSDCQALGELERLLREDAISDRLQCVHQICSAVASIVDDAEMKRAAEKYRLTGFEFQSIIACSLLVSTRLDPNEHLRNKMLFVHTYALV
jgi:hypothetical protein